jgi:hypothetical protein
MVKVVEQENMLMAIQAAVQGLIALSAALRTLRVY